MLSAKLVLLALGAVGVAYYLWTPLPDNIDNKTLLRVLAVIRKMSSLLVSSCYFETHLIV